MKRGRQGLVIRASESLFPAFVRTESNAFEVLIVCKVGNLGWRGARASVKPKTSGRSRPEALRGGKSKPLDEHWKANGKCLASIYSINSTMREQGLNSSDFAFHEQVLFRSSGLAEYIPNNPK